MPSLRPLTGKSVYVRSGAGGTYPILATAHRGDRLIALPEQNGWHRIAICCKGKRFTGYRAQIYRICIKEKEKMRNEMGDKIAMWIKSAAAAIGGAAAYLWGPWDALITALIALVAIDYVTGVICAAVNGKLNSSVGFKGLMKKALIFALVAVAGIADRVIPAANQAIRAAVILFYTANEAISIMENAAELGLPVPKRLKGMLTKAQNESEAE